MTSRRLKSSLVEPIRPKGESMKTIRQSLASWGLSVNTANPGLGPWGPLSECKDKESHFHPSNIDELLDGPSRGLSRRCSTYAHEELKHLLSVKSDVDFLKFLNPERIGELALGEHYATADVDELLLPHPSGQNFAELFDSKVKSLIRLHQEYAFKMIESYALYGNMYLAPRFNHGKLRAAEKNPELSFIEVESPAEFNVATLLRSLYVDVGNSSFVLPSSLIHWMPIAEAKKLTSYSSAGKRYLNSHPQASELPVLGSELLCGATPMFPGDTPEVLETFQVFRRNSNLLDAINAARVI